MVMRVLRYEIEETLCCMHKQCMPGDVFTLSTVKQTREIFQFFGLEGGKLRIQIIWPDEHPAFTTTGGIETTPALLWLLNQHYLPCGWGDGAWL